MTGNLWNNYQPWNDDLSTYLSTTYALKAGGIFTGPIQVPAGTASAPTVTFNDADTGFYSSAAKSLDAVLDGIRRLALYENSNLVSFRIGDIDTTLNASAAFVVRRSGNPSANVNLLALSDGSGTASHVSTVYSASNYPLFAANRARGSQASPALPSSGDILGAFEASACTPSGTFFPCGSERFDLIATTPSTTDLETKWRLRLNGPGSVSPVDVLEARVATGLTVLAPLRVKPGSSVTPATNGEITVELTANNTMTFRARGSDGVVRSVALALT